MIDQYGRTIDYLRVSITDRCNLRCRYCMPEGCQWLPMEEILTLEEIVELCSIAAGLGITKLKVTGGEPLVRRGCVELVSMLKRIHGIEQVTLTTNGVLLDELAQHLKDAGLDDINISLDTLQRERYLSITGRDELHSTLRGLEAALQAGLRTKVNAVLQRGVNEDEWKTLACLAKDHPIDVRFIEMMPIGYGKRFLPLSNRELLERFQREYQEILPDPAVHGNGPAVYYHIPDYQGSVGFISAIHGKFCASCNRVRLTSTGFMKSCLCYEDGADLREPLRQGHRNIVRQRMEQVMRKKPEAHCFEEPSTITEQKEMSKIGG